MKKIIIIILISYSICFTQEMGARYLIITHDNFYDAIQPLAQWKHKKGMRTKVVTLSEIGSTQYAIRDYIIDAYYNWQIQPEFLLLVGAPNFIPFPQISGTYTDNYYTNVDVEGDIYNEILSGRLTVHNTTEAQTVVNKILLYERTPDITDSLWFINACLIVREDYDSDDTIYWGDIHHAKNLMLNAGYNIIDTLSRAAGDDKYDVIACVNNGRSIVMYRGTGVNNWSSPFDVNPALTQNGPKLPIVLSTTCRTIGTSSTPAAAEQWFLTGTPTTPRGASGYFTTTTLVTSQAYLRSAVARGFFDAVFIDNKSTFGEACEGGRIRVYQMYPYLGGDEEYYGFTTIGDPEMNLWTASPKLITVSHDPFLNIGNDTLHVLVEYSGAPVESAFVCVVFDTIVYETGYTDGNGNIDFLLSLPDFGNLELTVTGKNLYPSETIIPIVSDTGYLIYNHHTISDSLGNNDGIVNSGETILLWIIIKNIGATPAYDVSATIRCNDTNIVIIDSISYYGDIVQQTARTGMNPYVFSVSPFCPSHTANFELVINDTEGNTWFGNFPVRISGVVGGGTGEIGPDAYGYYIYDDTDSSTGLAPEFEWSEIATPAGGPGTIIPQITDDDNDTVTIALPFTFKYYGLNYNSIGICTNGFLELGNATYHWGTNYTIPAYNGPKRMIAPFWDNLNPGYLYGGHGDIYQYYDAVNHRWILEFYEVAHRNDYYNHETFQVILYDPDFYPTLTGDGEILLLYSTIENATSNTVGIEDHTETRGLQYVYNNYYDPDAALLSSGRALLITTEQPPTVHVSPWLYITSYTLSDSISGNNNGIIEPGEIIDIYISIKNDGDTTAFDVDGTLRCNSFDVDILDSTTFFGDIAVGLHADNLDDAYKVSISANPSDSTFGFILYLSCNDGTYQKQDYFTVYLYELTGTKEQNVSDYEHSFGLAVYPNPCKGITNIRYSIGQRAKRAALKIYDVTGRLVRDFSLPTAYSLLPTTVTWDGTDDRGRKVPEGIYFIYFSAENYEKTEKVILLK